ncbi:DnaA regulatory inactivator Hda [Methylophaga pinxianii]|uniref:DnaA regulatory inactivator Hda n=1 Tax=Methylophaga pinxianii TaxID=2881052 RepID=UPI001CF33827|nr:DnaA regulatory inactivator Hda [Methylophaga pinxianii]MCB2427525.1 DnaA regulatory inactivator Hda [Methylophaga pinxianii]UPH44532.1 DnaA regulatory inactivator Hda [Methylophaga pinxianii]
MSQQETQLTLRLTPPEIFRIDNFIFENEELESVVEAFCTELKPDFLYLWGEAGVGKTHLNLAVAEQLQQRGHAVSYINLQELRDTAKAEVLASLVQTDIVCLDDLQVICGDREWEEALFHCFNRLREHEHKLLICANQNPAQLAIKLPDLRSRLATGLIYQLPVMTDALKQQALISHAQSRGLILPEEVAQYLLRHYSRDMPSLMLVLQRLDKASLRAQRRLTIPFVREVIQHG